MNRILLLAPAVPFVGGCLFYLKQSFEDTIASSSLDTNEYIYLSSDLAGRMLNDAIDGSGNDVIRQANPLINAAISKSVGNGTRQDNSSKFTIMPDLEALRLSQSSDLRESFKLALHPDANLNFFKRPFSKLILRLEDGTHHFELDELMIHILKCARGVKDSVPSECAQYLTKQALGIFEHNIDLNDIFNMDYGSKKVDLKRYKDLYFQTILENLLSSKEHVLCLLENGLLVLLHRLRELFHDRQVGGWSSPTYICMCLSAMSVHDEAHVHLFHTGWIGILVNWLNSSDLRLSLEAAKTLHNLTSKQKLNRSLYILHPIHQSRNSAPPEFESGFDIIFIHGLQGNVFKTWRQSGTCNNTLDYTACWPKSWLPKDFPEARIIAVNYQTFLSNWLVNCGNAPTLKERSLQLARELRDAHVGEKPVIWVTHSMGGLLVKEMLCQIECGDFPEKCLLEQTRGIVFFSVPHAGSEMAVWSPGVLQLAISPSAQVLELRKDSTTLKQLNQSFVDLVTNRPIDCLSFGESRPSTLLRNPIEYKFLLVPEDSANPGVGKFIVLPEDHFHICKPKDKQSESYQEVCKFITKLVGRKDNLMETLGNDLLLSSCVM